eukprot:TRINITY_DN25207_c0_g1_i1.p1 TRINITY_DN25207_c0_g1~~TRINITY_DN25207_c0_g1_i1.p1  ORF type:complete len:253 (-),score=38.54 TRINITY_DN25207_c0_g1_i1:61-819(-)
MSGARAVPIHWDMPKDEMRKLLGKINGVLFPGGDNEMLNKDGTFSPLALSHRVIMEYAKEQYYSGGYFPIFGICQGYEFLIPLDIDDPHILKPGFDSLRHSIPQKIISNSRLFRFLTNSQSDYLQSKDSLYFSHSLGITTRDILNGKASQNWKIISTAVDRKGKEFVAAIEHKVYPFYGMQPHPERSVFEWFKTKIVHSEKTVQIVQGLSNFLRSEALKNTNSFSDDVELARHLIQSYVPTVTTKYLSLIHI